MPPRRDDPRPRHDRPYPDHPDRPRRPDRPDPPIDVAPSSKQSDLIDPRSPKLSNAHPLLLLPVRLETRFHENLLKVRIYPDQIHLDEHERDLTEAEIDLGQSYWQQRLDTQPGSPERQCLDQWLADQLTARRAAWVARVMRPVIRGDGSHTSPKLAPRARAAAGIARCLPSRFRVLGHVRGVQRFAHSTSAVSGDLALSPQLADATPYSAAEGSLPVDARYAWMTDYDLAVASGMALTITLDAELLADVRRDGLTLKVFGLRDGSPAEGGRALAQLLEAHHFTDGLSIIPQGTPTNNTDDTAAGWSAAVADVPAMFARELDGVGLAVEDDSNARRLARALGLDAAALLERIPNGEDSEERSARAMNRVLWPATLGAYLDDLLAVYGGASIVPNATRDNLREWFVANVRGGGSLPTLQIGAQPYGLLPVRRPVVRKVLEGWWDTLEWLLLDLRDRWRESLPRVATINPVDGAAPGTSPDEAFVEVLGTVPHPGRLVVRRLTYQREIRLFFWEWIWVTIRETSHPLNPLAKWYDARASSIHDIADQIATLTTLRTQVDTLVVADQRDEGRTVVDALLALVEAHRDRQDPLQRYFPASLDGVFSSDRLNDPKILWSGYGNATEDRLFTHPLVEAVNASPGQGAEDYLEALRLRVPASGPEAVSAPRAFARRSPRRREPQGRRRVNVLRPDAIAPGPDAAIIAAPGSVPLSAAFHAAEPLLYQLIDAVIGSVPVNERTRYRAALATLRDADPDELTLRLRECLGTSTHRIDAWITGFARERLDAMRDDPEGTSGVILGGFGWVEGLRPDAGGTSASQGFIHAPSLAHAATAAVLRAGMNAHRGEHEQPFAIDLASDRVRLASEILDGVRQGQSVGDILGCRFERRLHDRGLDRYIDDCRVAALTHAGRVGEPRAPVDGLELVAAYQSVGVTAEGGTVRPDVSLATEGLRGLQHALDEILSAMDAVADATLADSVHHLLQGNTSRASVSLDAVATGDVPPPELRGLRTPVASACVTHRVLLLMDGTTSGYGWRASPRARTEPALDRWLATLVGDPARVVCRVAAETSGLPPKSVTLEEMATAYEMSCLDVIFTAPPGALTRDSAWGRRVVGSVAADAAYAPFASDFSVDFEATDVTLSVEQVSFADFAPLASALRTLVGSARSLDGRDLGLPGEELVPGWDLTEAEGRVEAVVTAFREAITALDLVVAGGGSTSADLRGTMHALSWTGMDDAVVTVGWTKAAEDQAALRTAAQTLSARGHARLAAIDGLVDVPAGDDARLRRARERLALVVGSDHPLLTRFVKAEAPVVHAMFQRSSELLGGSAATATAWLQKVAKVRRPVARLEEALTLSELVTDHITAAPVVGQRPDAAGEPWFATGAPRDRTQGRLALLVFHDDGGLAALGASRATCGLVFDAWLDKIPATEAVTGVAMHFDAPSSRAPQALLLITPPEGEPWSLDLIADSLDETQDAMKLRMVDPDILDGYGHQFPAVFPPGAIDAGPQPKGGS